MGRTTNHTTKSQKAAQVSTPKRKNYSRSVKTNVLFQGSKSPNNQNNNNHIYTTGFTCGLARAYVLKDNNMPGKKDSRVPAFTKPIENYCEEEKFRIDNNIDCILPIRKNRDNNVPITSKGQ